MWFYITDWKIDSFCLKRLPRFLFIQSCRQKHLLLWKVKRRLCRVRLGPKQEKVLVLSAVVSSLVRRDCVIFFTLLLALKLNSLPLVALLKSKEKQRPPALLLFFFFHFASIKFPPVAATWNICELITAAVTFCERSSVPVYSLMSPLGL